VCQEEIPGEGVEVPGGDTGCVRKRYLVRDVKFLVEMQGVSGSRRYLVREVKSLVEMQGVSGSRRYLVREVKSLVEMQGVSGLTAQ
jgi:hypothetical protein